MVRRELRACAEAFTFLTRLPAPCPATRDAHDLSRASTYFPVVGLVVGLAGGVAFAGAHLLWSSAFAVVIAVATTVWITGAFHEDALADSFDGFGGGWDRDQILAIMKDSRVGSYAVVGMILVVAAKIALLLSIASAGAPPLTCAVNVTRALVAGHVMGRWSSLPLLFRYPYVRPLNDGARSSAGRPFVGGVSAAQLAASSGIALLITVAAAGTRSAAVFLIVAIVTGFGGRYFHRRLGGITGDALGAANQLVELSVYVVLAAH